MVICDPALPESRLGPLVSKQQYDKVLGFVEQAKRDGTKLLTGGRRPPHLPRGYYLEPVRSQLMLVCPVARADAVLRGVRGNTPPSPTHVVLTVYHTPYTRRRSATPPRGPRGAAGLLRT